MTPVDIHTDRFVLRCLRAEDAQWIAKEISNPLVQKWLTSPPHPYEVHHATQYLESAVDDPRMRMICEGGARLGVVCIEDELGYWLSEPAWGRGVMSEAAHALLCWHFEHGGGTVDSGWIEGNQKSEGVLRKLGFVDNGVQTRYVNFRQSEYQVPRVILKSRSELQSRPQPRGMSSGALPYLATERLLTRPMTTADLSAFRTFAGQQDVARMTASIPSPFFQDEAEKWLAFRGWNNPPGFILAVTLKDGTLIGSISAGPSPNWGIGYIISPEYTGNGYATEALGSLVKALFELDDGPDEINACVFADNPASSQVLEKQGFEFVGECVSEAVARVEPSRDYQYRLTRGGLKGLAK